METREYSSEFDMVVNLWSRGEISRDRGREV